MILNLLFFPPQLPTPYSLFQNFLFPLLNRKNIMLFGGSLSLLGGLIYPWYQLPPLAESSFGINLLWMNLPRLMVAPLTLVWCLLMVWGRKKSARWLLWSGLLIPLLFPYFVHTWLPDVSYLNTAYYQQGSQAAAFSENHLPEVQAQWKQNIILEPVSPIRSLANLSLSDSRFFQPSAWDLIVQEGLGYQPSFLAFTRKGWELTMIGIIIILMGFYLQDGLEVLIADLRWVIPIAVLSFGCILFSLIGTNIVNYNLNIWFAQGQYERVVETSHRLQLWYPPLQADEAFLKRLGEAQFYGNQELTASNDFIKGLEQYQGGDLGQAQVDFQTTWELQPDFLPVRGYLASVLINQGVNAWHQFPSIRLSPLSNKRQVPYKRSFLDTSQSPESSPTYQAAIAAEFFEEALSVFPGHLTALNYLMLARAVNNQWEESAQIAQEIIDIEQYFHPPHLSLLGQAYLHLTWNDYHHGDLETAWQRYRQTIDPKTWKQPL
ncbi:MAG: hypothetical protein F6K47_22145 [Symploca sp. SIO2E6]|nr:hypothetical protein [Symploca sp. SIO2E6]